MIFRHVMNELNKSGQIGSCLVSVTRHECCSLQWQMVGVRTALAKARYLHAFYEQLA